MNLSKLLWAIAGILAVALVAVTGYLFFCREKIDSKVAQVPVVVEEKKQPISKTNTDWQKEWQKYLPNANFLEMKDVTGDGAPEVLVNSFIAQGGSGTPVDKVLVFTIKNNKAVEIPVYKNGLKRELSQYSGNGQASRVLFTNEGVGEQQRRSNGLNPGVYEILDSQDVYIWNINTERLEDTTKNSISLEKMEIKVYFQDLSKISETCGATNPVLVEESKTVTVADASLRFLFRYQLGAYGMYQSVEIQNGIAKVYIYEKKPSLASCEHEHLFSVLEKTLTQYPTIKKVELYRASDRSKIEF